MNPVLITHFRLFYVEQLGKLLKCIKPWKTPRKMEDYTESWGKFLSACYGQVFTYCSLFYYIGWLVRGASRFQQAVILIVRVEVSDTGTWRLVRADICTDRAVDLTKHKEMLFIYSDKSTKNHSLLSYLHYWRKTLLVSGYRGTLHHET